MLRYAPQAVPNVHVRGINISAHVIISNNRNWNMSAHLPVGKASTRTYNIGIDDYSLCIKSVIVEVFGVFNIQNHNNVYIYIWVNTKCHIVLKKAIPSINELFSIRFSTIISRTLVDKTSKSNFSSEKNSQIIKWKYNSTIEHNIYYSLSIWYREWEREIDGQKRAITYLDLFTTQKAIHSFFNSHLHLMLQILYGTTESSTESSVCM